MSASPKKTCVDLYIQQSGTSVFLVYAQKSNFELICILHPRGFCEYDKSLSKYLMR